MTSALAPAARSGIAIAGLRAGEIDKTSASSAARISARLPRAVETGIEVGHLAQVKAPGPCGEGVGT
ncbi:MAG: hypothetical protein ABSC25_13930 [Roseiarcus sp.]|jgi:hypothetical protein